MRLTSDTTRARLGGSRALIVAGAWIAAVVATDIAFNQSVLFVTLLGVAPLISVAAPRWKLTAVTAVASDVTALVLGLADGNLWSGQHAVDVALVVVVGVIAVWIAVLRERLQESLKDLHEAHELRRSMTADVAHEIRTPLAILRASAEALLDGVVTFDETSISSLHEEVLRLTRIVSDLEVLAISDGTGLSLLREDLDLGEVVSRATCAFLPQFEEKGVNIELTAQPAAIHGDKVRMAQVVTNLLSNALKFTPTGGHVHVSVYQRGGWAAIEVSDDGIGIPDEDLEHVFSRFWRGRDAGRVSGDGIGLAVVKDLVDAHHGFANVHVPVSGGTVFTVKIPARDAGTAG